MSHDEELNDDGSVESIPHDDHEAQLDVKPDESVNENEIEDVEEDEDDDDFDDFNEVDFQQAPTNEPSTNNDDEDDEFGDFDEPQPPTQNPSLPTSTFTNPPEFSSKLTTILDSIFPTPSQQQPQNPQSNQDSILSERSGVIYKQISTLPYLHPPNWIKSNIRHNLLIKLGIPINLDELKSQKPDQPTNNGNGNNGGNGQRRRRKSGIALDDIKWDAFEIPPFEDLKIDSDEKIKLIKSTGDILTRIEMDNLKHSEDFYRANTNGNNEEFINENLEILKSNYDELLQLSSVWINHSLELKADFEIYENVIQSYIGYTQKLRRDEIFENLKKLKHTKKNKAK
ncbi:hypothetical protein G210_2747 [Candida maltosa Xu316]|uniref:Uncharacterized protein n=1 Tax=Candida maltosa (strain Xu316) TaxID=1245528 RepID=M3HTY4_CANMX|nr:hypothetical protein G210_2747 [Candida maltosa Xu316]